MDKIRFCVDYNKLYWIITPDSKKPMLLTYPNNWEYIILIESIIDGGITIPPKLVLYSIQILKK